MHVRSIALAGLLAMSAAGSADAAPKKAATSGLSVVQSGGEAALILDGTIMPRPFGATLVDRLTVIDRFPLAANRTVWLIRGDGSETCDSQYMLVDRVSGQQPDLSSVFGCNATVTGRARSGAVRLSVVSPTLPKAELAWRRGTLEPVDAAGEVVQADVGCRNPAATAEEVDVALGTALPPELRRRGTLKRAAMADAELQARVGDLACLATWPGSEKRVVEAATPLFVSKAWGEAAFAALDRIALQPGSPQDVRSAVRLFSGRMRYAVAAREPI
jgi:hypothetical protein